MFAHFDFNLLVLLILLGFGVFSQNKAVMIATAVLIIVKITPLNQLFPYIQQHGLNIGIIILTIGVLSPIASGKLSGESILKSFLSYKSLLAIAVGVFVAWLGGRGVKLMSHQLDVVAGLLIGTVAGVALLRGVPVGPLIAAGILSILIGKS
jgi:uncharacterized membrane protein (DUF441 family)